MQTHELIPEGRFCSITSVYRAAALSSEPASRLEASNGIARKALGQIGTFGTAPRMVPAAADQGCLPRWQRSW